jgi:hypothetical protein
MVTVFQLKKRDGSMLVKKENELIRKSINNFSLKKKEISLFNF